MNVEIQQLHPNNLKDFKELISVFEDVFEMENFTMPSDSHLLNLLKKDTFFAIIAISENKVVGGLTLYLLDQYYSSKPLAYLYDLAVLTPFQRQGIGKKLIDFTIKFCREKGFEEVFVQADKVDDHAIDFYRLTKPTAEEQVVQFYYKLGTTNKKS